MTSVNEPPAQRCSTGCGMCSSCVFAPEPPGSAGCSWTLSDELRRNFIVGLILRCTSADVLQTVRDALSFTSWDFFNYGRSESLTCLQNSLSGTRNRASGGNPPGLDVSGIWDWFTGSTDVTKSRYLLRLFSFCDSELLRMAANLTNVLLLRQQRGLLQIDAGSLSPKPHEQGLEEDSENPALTVVPGSSESMSGVSQYRDFISCLPGHLSKAILGLLDRQTLRRCQKVCQRWQHLARETLREVKLRRSFQELTRATMKKYTRIRTVSHTYANVVDVPVPVKDDEDAEPRDQQGDIFKSAYGQIRTKLLRMEERNVFCGTYFTTVLLDREDPNRVVDYRNGPLMAVGSKDLVLHLYYVACELRPLKVLKGHVGSIRSVLLCEDKQLVITGSLDSSIRCWDLKTDKCLMILYGHNGAVTCLDLHGDKFVSGAKDHLVKVWNLQTKRVEKCHFKHPAPVQSVKISSSRVYSSCDRGLVKVWDLGDMSLLRVIDAHRSSVRCLFLDRLHFFSADVDGQVMSWSSVGDVQQCLMTFKHPKEVRSVALLFLRVLTGCVDGKIRVFNFLTGDCLKVIPAEAESVGLLSVHFHDNGILVNSRSRISRFQFAKVFWDYAAGGIQAEASGSPGAAPHLEHQEPPEPPKSTWKQTHEKQSSKSDRFTSFSRSGVLTPSAPAPVQGKEGGDKTSAPLSAKTSNERMKKRLPQRPAHDSAPCRAQQHPAGAPHPGQPGATGQRRGLGQRGAALGQPGGLVSVEDQASLSEKADVDQISCNCCEVGGLRRV